MDQNKFSIGTLGRATGVKVVTIRYYEKIGLLSAPPRSESNYRLYGSSELKRLGFIRRCRELGFTLDQIRELLSLGEQANQDCCAVDQLAHGHRLMIEHKISDLERLASELRRISSQCQGGVIADCRILEALSS